MARRANPKLSSQFLTAAFERREGLLRVDLGRLEAARDTFATVADISRTGIARFGCHGLGNSCGTCDTGRADQR